MNRVHYGSAGPDNVVDNQSNWSTGQVDQLVVSNQTGPLAKMASNASPQRSVSEFFLRLGSY